MSKPGSHDHAAAVAARRGLDAGLTRLGIALVTHVASRGTNFQTDLALQDEVRRPDGRAYHRESIGRKRRELTRAGILSARRYYPGQRPPNAKFRTTHGVVATAVVWEALRVTAPTLRGARRAERVRLARASRPPTDIMTPAELADAAEAFLAKQRGKPPPD